MYCIYSRFLTIDGVSVDICPPNKRKSLDGTKWICDNPADVPEGAELLETLTLEQATALMATSGWSEGEDK